MMRRPPTRRSAEQVAMDEIADEIERVSDAIAAELGPAPDAISFSDTREAALFWQMDPTVDPNALFHQLTTTGLMQADPDRIDPESPTCLEYVKQQPQMAEFFADPVAPEVANDLVTLALFPLRHGLMADYKHDPKGMVSRADRLLALGPTGTEMPSEQAAPMEPAPAMGGQYG